jgi:hypothetical protein
MTKTGQGPWLRVPEAARYTGLSAPLSTNCAATAEARAMSGRDGASSTVRIGAMNGL